MKDDPLYNLVKLFVSKGKLFFVKTC